MPIYEFQCNQCGTVFDRLQKLSDPDPTDCPNCQTPEISRRLTAPAFRLAGSGWYETDFKKDGDKKRNLAGAGDGDSAKPTASGDAPKTESAKSESPKAEAKAPAPAASPKAD